MIRNFTLIVLMMLVSQTGLCAVINVPADQPTIQAGIDSAVEGDTVLVADGTYTGPGNRNIDFNGKNLVLMSQNGSENTTMDCELVGQAFYLHSSEDSSTIIRGFTITHASGIDTIGQPEEGPAVECDSVSPRFTGCKFTDNQGTVYLYKSQAHFDSCAFVDNPSLDLDLVHGLCSDLNFRDCSFSRNTSMSTFQWSTAAFVNCVFSENYGGQTSSALLAGRSEITLSFCEVSDNYTLAMFISGSDVEIEDCVFSDNRGDIIGCLVIENCTVEAYRSLFTKNSAAHGGSIFCVTSSALFEACDFVADSADEGSVAYILPSGGPSSLSFDRCNFAYSLGGMPLEGDSMQLRCCNVYGNEGGDWVGSIADQASLPGNFSSDPMYCDWENGDFHVYNGSPCAPENSGCDGQVGTFGVGCYLGDADGTGQVDIDDVVFLLNYIFLNGPEPDPLSLGDATWDGVIDIDDVVYIIGIIFVL